MEKICGLHSECKWLKSSLVGWSGLSRHLPRAGFTLVETLVGTAVMMMFFGAIVVILQTVLGLVGESRVRIVAAALAGQKIERVRNLAYEDVGTVGGIPPGSLLATETVEVNGQSFLVKTSVMFIDDPFDGLAPDDLVSGDYKRVRVSVSWGGAYPSKTPLAMVTDVAPKGLETDGGGGVLRVKVINAQGELVEGAKVLVENDQVVPGINLEAISDSSGQVLLPGAPSCNDCYRIKAEKAGYSSDRTYSTQEVTNPVKPDAGVIEDQVTQVTLAIDLVSTINLTMTGSRLAGYIPFAGVSFNLRGNRVIGTNALDEPVYKFDQDFVSGAGGLLTIEDLEWDTYEVTFPESATVDFAGSVPVSPFALLPGENLELTVVTAPATDDSLLVVIEDQTQSLIDGAGVVLTPDTGPEVYGVTGPVDKGDYGQVLFGDLVAGNYGLVATKSGFLQATASANVSGDTKELVVLESE